MTTFCIVVAIAVLLDIALVAAFLYFYPEDRNRLLSRIKGWKEQGGLTAAGWFWLLYFVLLATIIWGILTAP